MANEARQISNITVKWTAAGTTSDVCGGAQGLSIVGVIFPAVFAGATITLQTSPDGVTFTPLNYSPGDGTSVAVSLPKVLSTCVAVDPVKTLSLQYLKVVSASSEAAGTQLKLVCASAA
jgi:hypothetical protein